jgi:hypothetical protein
LKQIDIKGASGMNIFFAGSCLSGGGIVLKEPSAINVVDEIFIKAETFINSQSRFFHYEPLTTSSFRKNYNHS